MRGNAEARSGAAETDRSTLFDATSKAVLARDSELIARAWLALAQLLLDFRDRIDEAFDVLRVTHSYVSQLPEDHPLQASFHHLRGTALSRASRFDEGLEDLTRAVELGRAADSPELPDFILARTLALVSSHQVEQARQLSAEALALTRWARITRSTRMRSSRPRARRRGSAIPHRRSCIWRKRRASCGRPITRTAPRSSMPSISSAWALKDNGRFEEGIEVLEQALAMERGFEATRLRIIASLHNRLGDTYYEQDHPSLGMR